MRVNSKAAPRLAAARPSATRGLMKLGYLLMLGALAVAALVVLKFGPWGGGAVSGAAAEAGAASTGPREVDYGLVELIQGLPAPVTSYKHGGNMVLYAGEELRFQVNGNAPLPAIELRAGAGKQMLPGADGAVQVAGPANQALPALMVAQGSRVSLPGNAPPRVSVKVQVFGAARPK